MYQKIPDPTPPFGMDRSPPHHFLQRLRNFPPNLQDLIVVASTSSSDVGLFTRSETALASDLPAEKITNVFTTTSMANDSRRAQLPMAEDITDTSPIGVAMDLSCTEKVPRPLPGEEIDESSGPLPAIMILNNEGVLASWWIVYAASVRQNTTYPGLVAAGGRQSLPLSQVPANKSPSTHSGYQQNNSAFGQSAFRGAPFTSVSPNKPSTPAFGTSESTSLNAAFGTSSTLGSQKSPWASAAATTTPQTGVAAFGTAGGLGQRVSPWGPPSSTGQTPGSIFGQSSGLGMRPGAAFSNTTGPGVFGSNPQTHDSASKMPPSGGFASFAKGSGSGFAAAAPQNQAGGLFGSTKPGTSFGTSMETDSVFGGSSKVDGMGLSNVIGGTEFTLGSTFKSDGTSVDDKPKQPGNIEHGFFGSEFNDGIEDLQKQPQTSHLKEMKMAEGDEASDHDASSGASPTVHEQSPAIAETTSPTFQHPNTAPPVSGGFFGTQAQSKVTPAEVQSSTPTTSSFPKSELISTTPIDTPKKPDENFDNTVEESPLAIKSEPQDETTSGIDEVIPDPPLPPDPTSKDTYSPGDTSQSSTSASKSTVDDAPLPPDFLVEKSQVFKQEPQEEVSLPAEDEDSGLDDEGSGVDVANEISSNTDPTQTPKVTPASSFGVSFERSPSAMFSQMAGQQRPLKSNQLFGEVGKSSVPLFPPPAKTQGSPRSPSPVRSHLSVASLRPDNSRSVSAPSAASKALSNRKAALSQNTKLSEPRLSVEDQRNHEQELLTAQRAQRQAEEEQDLSDKEDEKVREELATEVEATTILEPFLAHQDYVGNINKPGLPGQIEKVYRDINSMIDTIGLNARSLQAFMKGHDTIPSRDHSQQDLERNDWRLAEIDDLSRIESQIAQELAIGQVQSVPSKVDLCHELQRGLSKLQTKNSDIVRLVQVQSDPETRLTARSAPLSPEQSLSQHDLRKRFTNFQKILAEAESSVTMLRAALASCETTGKDGVYPQKPTVEAVMSTIMKMTKMVEKRSGDIDVLEAQMRKMRISSFTNGTPLAPSTPNKANKELKPSRDPQGGLRASVSERGSPWRGRNDMTQDEDRRFREKVRRRKIINATLKEAIQSRKPRIRTVEC